MYAARPLLALLPLSLALAIVAPIPDRPVAVERMRADYRENGLPDGRVLAALELVLFRAGVGTWLEVRASAKGPRVDPGRGFQNIQGFNRQTTRDFEAILESHMLEVRVVDAAGESVAGGSVHPGTRGALQERRLRADGSIDHHATREVLLELIARTDALPPGEYHVELVLRDEIRLRVGVRIDIHGGKILRVEDLGHDSLLRWTP